MADDEEIPSSEEDDDDYVPSDLSDEDNTGAAGKRKKRKKRNATVVGKRKILKLDGENDEEESDKTEQSSQSDVNIRDEFENEHKLIKEEKQKQKADDLWASFMSDVKPKSSKTTIIKDQHTADKTLESKKTAVAASRTYKPPGKVTVSKVFDFAGEEIKITEEVEADSKAAKQAARNDSEQGQSSKSQSLQKSSLLSKVIKRPGGGLSGLLNRIEKKPKISTLEKSKLDWDGYKKDLGIEDEVLVNLKSKGGYLEKQDFLQRADVRQFEIERDQRAANRKFTS